jgi:pimeloyl-ACP methyl ester carboxylesterase
MKLPISILLPFIYSLSIFGQSPQTEPRKPIQLGDPIQTLDKGKLLVFSGGAQVGVEQFHINANGISESSDELHLGGNIVKFKTMFFPVAANSGRARFVIAQEPSVRTEFEIEGSKVKVTGSKEATGQTDPDAVLLENNVWYQYYYLTKRYAGQRGGVQQLKAFVPSIMKTVPVSIELKEEVRKDLPGALTALRRYEVNVAGKFKIGILTDSSGKLLYVGVPSQRAEAVREEHADSLARLRAMVSTGATESAVKPDYSSPPGASFVSQEVVLPVKNYSLAGTLLIPKDCGRPCPAVVMITGSGQQTRDEPIPIPGLENYRPFRQIAEALAGRKIAVFRVDDRGVGDSTGRETLGSATTSDFANDTRAEVAYLRTRKEIDPDRIALIGHSEGGTIAPMVAASDSRIAAIVLLAGAGKRGSEISYYQVQQALDADPNLTKEQKEKKLSDQREVAKAIETGADLSKYPAQARVPWVKEFFTYDPIPTIRKVKQPVLILQGSVDQQITADNAKLLEEAARDARNAGVAVKVFPGLNHLFLPAHTGAVSEYSSLTTNAIPDEVLTTMGEWLQGRLHTR